MWWAELPVFSVSTKLEPANYCLCKFCYCLNTSETKRSLTDWSNLASLFRILKTGRSSNKVKGQVEETSKTSGRMPSAIRRYVKFIDKLNRGVGLVAMYMIFAMMGVLLYSSISKTFFDPALWTLEVAQFSMVAYFLLGGGYSLQMGAHVRMDLAYGKWSPRTQAAVDTVTILLLIFFLVVLLYGGISSTHYAIKYNEESRSIWAPRMAPIKIIMDIGIFLTLLQAIAIFFSTLAKALDKDMS